MWLKSLIIIIPLVIIALLLGGYLYLESLTQPINLTDVTPQIFIIRKGQTINSIAEALTKQQLIKNPIGFKYVVYRYQLTKQIQAGSFKLSPAMNVNTIARTLTHGSEDVWVTLVEGWRREEIAAALAKVLPNFNQAEFLNLTENKEGYLYPDTYLIPLTATESDLVSLLENTFNQKVSRNLRDEIAASNKSLASILTMASLIEREAKTSPSRKMVSGILWKRLENGWPLQVDATLQYAIGYDPVHQTWWREPLAADKEIVSPYNTYQNQGLPPGPICSPSLSSIEAAINPTASDYWFYLTGNDNQMHYAKTTAEHAQNIAKYLR